MIGFFVSLAIFWFITVVVSQDHRTDYITILLWGFIAVGLSEIISYLPNMFDVSVNFYVFYWIRAVTQLIVLGYALYFRLDIGYKKTSLILAIYFTLIHGIYFSFLYFLHLR
jgi:hypothetical protein